MTDVLWSRESLALGEAGRRGYSVLSLQNNLYRFYNICINSEYSKMETLLQVKECVNESTQRGAGRQGGLHVASFSRLNPCTLSHQAAGVWRQLGPERAAPLLRVPAGPARPGLEPAVRADAWAHTHTCTCVWGLPGTAWWEWPGKAAWAAGRSRVCWLRGKCSHVPRGPIRLAQV